MYKMNHSTIPRRYQGFAIVPLLFLVVLLGAVMSTGCASLRAKEEQLRFKSYLDDHQFESRIAHTDISREKDADLLKKGYVPIGSFKVTHDQDKAYGTDPTTRLLVEAADYGGELVTLSFNNETRTRTKRKKTKCLEVKRELVNMWDPYEAIDVWKEIEVCVRWEYEVKKIRVVESAGTVWRNEPDIVQEYANAILFMSIEDNNSSLVRGLIENDYVDVNVTDKFGWTPLIHVSFNGGRENYEMAKILVKKGAQVNARDGGGKTALIRAVMNENMDIAELLIKHGAVPRAVDNEGKSALDYASEENLGIIKKWLK